MPVQEILPVTSTERVIQWGCYGFNGNERGPVCVGQEKGLVRLRLAKRMAVRTLPDPTATALAIDRECVRTVTGGRRHHRDPAREPTAVSLGRA